MCTCDETKPHVVARSVTADGVALERWSDGDITGRMGQYPPGLSKSRDARTAQNAAAVLWGNICLYDWAELGALIRRTRKEVRIPLDKQIP